MTVIDGSREMVGLEGSGPAFATEGYGLRLAAAELERVACKPGRCALPILTGVLVEAGEGSVTLTATDLEVTLRVVLPANVIGEGSVVVPARALRDATKPVRKPRKGTEGELVTFAGSVLEVGAVAHTFDDVGAVGDWPAVTVADGGDSQAVDPDALGFVAGFTAPDASRPILTGVLIDRDGRYVATDSYRLAYVDTRWTGGGEGSVVVPARACKLVAKRDGTPNVTYGDREVTFRWGDGTELTARTVEGDFPAYRSLVPAEADRGDRWTFADVAALRAVVKQAGKDARVTLEPVAGGSFDVRTATATATVAGCTDGEGFAATYNATYLLSVLAGFDGSAVIRVRDERKPAVLEVGATVRLLMPLR